MGRIRTRNKRTRPNRRNGGSGTPSRPSRTLTEKQLKEAKRVHEQRKPHAQRIDDSMKASIAGSLDQWLAEPHRYDLPGVDYPGKSLQEAIEQIKEQERGKKPKRKRKVASQPEISKNNPFKDSKSSKKLIRPMLEEYKNKLGIKGEVKLSAVNRGHPAKIIHERGKDPVVRFNYDHFKHLHELVDRDIVEKYMEYAVAHELAHAQQKQEMGYKEYRAYKKQKLNEFEYDADLRACRMLGTTPEDIQSMIDETEADLLKQSNSPVKQLEEKPPKIARPAFADYIDVPVEALSDIPGIGAKTIQGFKDAGLTDIGEIHRLSASGWKALTSVEGIGDETAKDLYKQINTHVPTRDEYEPEPVIEIPDKKDAPETREIPSHYKEWVSKAESQGDLDTVMVQLNKDQQLTMSQRHRVAGLVEEKREHLVRETELGKPSEEDFSEMLDRMYPDGNIGKSRNELKTSVAGWVAEKKGIDIDNPRSQYEEHIIETIEPLSDRLVERMIDGHWFKEHNGKLYMEGMPRIRRSINPAQVEKTMRSLIKQNPDITDQEIIDTVIDVYAVEPEAESSFGVLARDKLGEIRDTDYRLNELKQDFKEKYVEALGVALDHQTRNRFNELYDELIDRGYTSEEAGKIAHNEFNEQALKEQYRDELETKQEEYLDEAFRYLVEASSNPVEDLEKAIKNHTYDSATHQQAGEVVEKAISDIAKQHKLKAPRVTGALQRPKSSKARKEFYQKATPYTYLANMDKYDSVEVNGDTLQVKGMDPSHVAMTVTEIPNRLGIPDGEYGGEILDKDTFTKSMVKYPDKIEYQHMHKGGQIHITKGDKTARIALHRDKPEELPDPKIFYKAKGKVNLAKLRDLVESRPEEHIFFSTFEEDDRVKLRAWCNEERPGASPISHETILSDDIIIDENHRGEKEHQKVIFTRRYFEDLLEALDHQGVDEGYIRLVTDMPLKLEIENREQQTDYYQAPCIGVADPELDYNPENPRTSITSDKYPKQEWRNRAIPYSAFMNTGREEGGNVEVEAQGHRIALRSIDSDHTMLTEVETRNHLDLPNGKYAGDFVERGNKTTLKYPEKLSYDPDTHQLILRKNDDKMIADITPDAEGYVPKRSKGKQIGKPIYRTSATA